MLAFPVMKFHDRKAAHFKAFARNTMPQSLLTTLKPPDITSRGITLILWRRAKQIIIAKSKRPYLFKNMSQISMQMSEVKSWCFVNLVHFYSLLLSICSI